MPRPNNLQELQSFMGKINYYHKFIDNLSDISAPLNELRKSDVKYVWTSLQQKAFDYLKNKIADAARVVHFRDDYPVVLATDASSYGLGAVISHIYPDGSERPIAFASKTLTDAQRRYGQIEKEALSIIFGVTKFVQFLFGRRFILQTDHKPLVSLFGPKDKYPVVVANRLSRWEIILRRYTFDIKYRSTKHHCNADALSRLPIGPDIEFDKSEVSCEDVNEIYEECLQTFPLNSVSIAEATKQDPVLKKVSYFIEFGWPNYLSIVEEIRPYFEKRMALTIHDDVILLQTEHLRVVVPSTIQSHIIDLLHLGHWGVVRMKQMARRYVWFPGIDNALNEKAASCEVCQQTSADPKREFCDWPKPQYAWERIHLDFAGPFWGCYWLIVVDAFSRFPYLVSLKQITSEKTIAALRAIFDIEGLPDTVVSDNGTQLTSREFEEFMKEGNVTHLTTAPFHPASNGEAERFVRTIKSILGKLALDGQERDRAVSTFLTTYRSTPLPSINKSPAELLHGRQPKNYLAALLPKFNKHNENDKKSKFNINDLVWVKNFSRGQKWVKGDVVDYRGKMMYTINTEKGFWKRHQNQMNIRRECLKRNNVNIEIIPNLSRGDSPIKVVIPQTASNRQSPISNEVQQTPRRSTRTQRPVVRFVPGV